MATAESIKVYQQIARSLQAARNCATNTTRVMDGEQDVTVQHWRDMERHHRATIDALVKRQMPSGSGWDSGTVFQHEDSTPDHLIFHGSYHHMNDGGYYDGWTDHVIHVRPSLAFGIDVRITGRNRNDVKSYLADLFQEALTTAVTA